MYEQQVDCAKQLFRLQNCNDEEIDGKAFLELTEKDISEMGFKLGPKKHLMRLLQSVTAVNRINVIVGSEPLIISSAGDVVIENASNIENLDGRGGANVVPSDANSNVYQPAKESIIKIWVQNRDNNQVKLNPLLPALETGIISSKDRSEFVRLVMTEWLKLRTSNKWYPSADEKEQLAKDIISTFPKLRSSEGKGYEYFFERKTANGYLEFFLKNHRRNLDKNEKKRQRTTKQQDEAKRMRVQLSLLNEDSFKSKVAKLNFIMPTEANKASIVQLTTEIRPNRQEEILNSNMTVTNILQKYPRFKDFQGQLILEEFQAQYGEDSLVEQFAVFYAPKILEYCKTTKPHLLRSVQDLKDDILKAIILLPELLPSPNHAKRRSKKKLTSSKGNTRTMSCPAAPEFAPRDVPNVHLLQFAKDLDDVLLATNSVTKKAKVTQPSLICVSSVGDDREGEFYLKADQITISIGNVAMRALELLVKFHFVFYVKYAADLENFYDFITNSVMKMNKPKPCSVSLNTALQNVKLDEINAEGSADEMESLHSDENEDDQN